MKSFLKDNWFKLGIIVSVLLVSGSFVYYFTYSAPKNRAFELELQKAALLSQNQKNQEIILTPTLSPTPDLNSPTPVSSPTPQPVISNKTGTKTVLEPKVTIIPQSNVQTSSLSPLTVKGSKDNFYKSSDSYGDFALNSRVSIPFYTYKKVVIRKIQVEIEKTYYGDSDKILAFSIDIQGSVFKLQQNGNYLTWEGYKEINGTNLFSISFIVPESFCFWYKINNNSLSIFERVEYDTQNNAQNSYSEYPITLAGEFPFISQKACNKQ